MTKRNERRARATAAEPPFTVDDLLAELDAATAPPPLRQPGDIDAMMLMARWHCSVHAVRDRMRRAAGWQQLLVFDPARHRQVTVWRRARTKT